MFVRGHNIDLGNVYIENKIEAITIFAQFFVSVKNILFMYAKIFSF